MRAGVTILVLVRHGQASFGARNYDKLSAVGERQGTLLGQHWLGNDRGGFDAVYSGAMERQKVTAERAFAALGTQPAINIEPAFNEFDHDSVIRAYLPLIAREHPDFVVDPKKLFNDHDTFEKLFDRLAAYWISGRIGDAPVAETWEAFEARCLEGVRRIAEAGHRRGVAFTSGGVITAVLRHALDLEPEKAFRLNWEILNGSVHSFRLSKQRVVLQRFNDIAHLEAEGDESLLTYR